MVRPVPPARRGRRRRRARFGATGFALGALVLVAVQGCGPGAQTLRPGVAADVDGTTVSFTQVDAATAAYCRARSAQPDLDPVPRSQGRDLMLDALIQRAVADRINAEPGYRFTTTSAYAGAVSRAEASLTSLDAGQVDDLLDAFTGTSYFADLVGQFGAKAVPAGTTSTSTGLDPAIGAGLDVVDAWLREHPVTTDPAFSSFTGVRLQSVAQGTYLVTDGSRTDLSVAGSSQARDALDAVGPSPSTAATAYAESLPSTQQCG